MLLDYQGHNFARKLAFAIHSRHNTGMIAARLPQHVSLGPGFEIDLKELPQVEAYFREMAQTTPALTLQFTKIGLRVSPNDNGGLGIIWMEVCETPVLRGLHRRIYSDIRKFGWKVDWLDGERYLFHSTLIYGGQPGDKFREIYNDIPEKQIQLQSRAEQIALFCPPDATNTPGTFFTYQILPLGVK